MQTDGMVPEPSENEPGMLAVTINHALARLGISNHTLAKWMERLSITSTRHPLDWRLHMLLVADVERIEQARASIPRSEARGSRTPLYPAKPRQRLPTHAQEAPQSPRSAEVTGDVVKLSTLASVLHVPLKTAKEALGAGHFRGFKESSASNAAWLLDAEGQEGFRRWAAEVHVSRR